MSFDNLKLPVTVYSGDGSSAPQARPTIIFAHACDGGWRPWHADFIKTFRSWGYNVVAPDSFTPRGIGKDCDLVSKLPSRYRALDMGVVADWVAGQPWHKGNIGLVGYSHGGTTVQAYSKAPNSEKIVAAVAIYPGCAHDPREGKIPIQIHIGDKDAMARPDDCERFKVENSAVFIYQGAYHAYDVPEPPRAGYGGNHLEYNAAATALTYSRIKEFFGSQLSR